ncbi:MAG: phenylacetate--CoA ligase family protein [Limisphaerales bacterium]
MTLVERASRIYGQLRGYERWTIGRQVDETETLTADEVRRRQAAKFQALIRHSIKRFPSYRDLVEQHCGRLPGEKEELQPRELPVWTKTNQRELFNQLNPDDFKGCFVHASGGSTGEPTRFYMTRRSSEWRQAVAERGYGWGQAALGVRTLHIWSDPAKNPGWLGEQKARLHHWIENRADFNCFFFNDERKRECCQLINEVKPVTIVAYAGKAAELAVFVRDKPGLLKWKTKHMLTGAEGLQPGQRELIKEHLGADTFMSYGCREVKLIGMESFHHNGYHLSDDNLYVEVADENGQPVKSGETGRILVSDLHNDTNPFVRYEVGDLGIMADESEPCPEGFPFRRLVSVVGRNQEYIYTPDGAKITAIYFAHNLKELHWINAYQLVQKAKNHLLVRLVSGETVSDEMKQDADKQIRPKLGDMKLDFEQVSELEKRANGKIPVIVSEIDQAQNA